MTKTNNDTSLNNNHNNDNTNRPRVYMIAGGETNRTAQDRESIEVRESRRVVLGDIQQKGSALGEHKGSSRGYPLNYPP